MDEDFYTANAGWNKIHHLQSTILTKVGPLECDFESHFPRKATGLVLSNNWPGFVTRPGNPAWEHVQQVLWV